MALASLLRASPLPRATRARRAAPALLRAAAAPAVGPAAADAAAAAPAGEPAASLVSYEAAAAVGFLLAAAKVFSAPEDVLAVGFPGASAVAVKAGVPYITGSGAWHLQICRPVPPGPASSATIWLEQPGSRPPLCCASLLQRLPAAPGSAFVFCASFFFFFSFFSL